MNKLNRTTKQDASSFKEATATTKAANAQLATTLPFADKEDFENARRGFIATLATDTIQTEDGRVVWDLGAYAFLKSATVPPTVNPSLWRQAQLNFTHGLFKVTDRIYQIRGFDLSNMTIIEGDTGLIIIDPLTCTETAQAGLNLYYEHFPKKPVVAVIYTHSHTDHYGGVKGVISEEDIKAGKVKILAPEGFLEHAVSENIFAGNAMSRRSIYMYAALLPKNIHGQVDAGLGKTVSLGTVTLIPPTDIIHKTGEQRNIDGIEMMFQMALETEAPSEMLIYFPQLQALCAAEDMTHNLHNLYTLRGAEVRNAVAWWKTINEAIENFGERTAVVFAQHHWPTWGKQNIQTFFTKQRDLYKYIHDQALHLMNQGYTMLEVAEMMQLPESLAIPWYNRDYYGSVNHNAKAVYQKYLGFYSSNPAELHPLPPVDAAKKYVEYMGGPEAVMQKARASFDAGDYRWVAQVMNHVVFAYPDNRQAREFQADALEQLGYQAENPTWRNEYLVGAFELRNGIPQAPATKADSPDVLQAMTLSMYFDYMGIRLNGPRAKDKTIKLNWIFSDVNERYAVRLENCALTYTANKQLAQPDATITLTRAILDAINLGATTFEHEMSFSAIQVEGDQSKFTDLLSLLDTFEQSFAIVTP